MLENRYELAFEIKLIETLRDKTCNTDLNTTIQQ